MTQLPLLVSMFAMPAWQQTPTPCRLYLASRDDWAGKSGFYLDFEGTRLADLPLILAVGDGNAWRFVSHTPPFVVDRGYTIRAVVSPQNARLFLDGKQVGETAGHWLPTSGALEINHKPQWCSGRGDWLAIVESVVVVLTRGETQVARLDFDFARDAARPVPLQLFEPGHPRRAALDAKAGDTLTIDVALRFTSGDPKTCAPLIDRYGQCRYADWPEKVRTDEDLTGDIAREDADLAAMPPSSDFDQYGGYGKAAWKEKGTGFFRVLRREGFWWLISPAGNPCFYMGVCSFPAQTWPPTPVSDREFLFEWLPPHEPPWTAAWSSNHWGVHDGTEYVCHYACNLIRKYGPQDWFVRAGERGARRLKAWGFSGGGKWGAPTGFVETPVLSRGATPSLAGHPDVFDPKVCEVFRTELQRQIAPRRDDPSVLGWSLGNEYDEIIKHTEIVEILKKPADVPARKALIDHAVERIYGGDVSKAASAWKLLSATRQDLDRGCPEPSAEDVETLRRFYADRYYDFIYRTVRQIDPNHLYFGFWITYGWWESAEDWRLIARHCDVLGYDHYSPEYADDGLQKLERESGKPTFRGEFSFPGWYDGLRGYGRYHTFAQDDADAGELYHRWVQAAARDPYCVGGLWFKYHDQPLTGRGPGRGPDVTHGEHYAFGLVTITDRVKWPLVRRMREANLQAPVWRLAAAAAGK